MLLTVSFRRTLLVLLFVMVFLIFVVYWSQNGNADDKPSNDLTNVFGAKLFNGNGFDRRRQLDDPFPNKLLVPPEKTWTYKCLNNRCVRRHYLNTSKHANKKRVPFQTCAMTCGPANLWPQPTIKTVLGSKALKFKSSDIKFSVNSAYKNVNNLLKSAFDIFLREIADFELGVVGTAVESSRNINRNNNNNNEGKHGSVNSKFSDNNNNLVTEEKVENNNEISDNFLPFLSLGSQKKYDVKFFNINAKVTQSSDTYLTLRTDENTDKTVDVKIFAKSFFGARHALTTLQQLIWYDDEDDSLKVLNQAFIDDVPKFNYRGLMLDTSRHYFSVESIKRTIVGMAHSKLNRFHWHLTDSQSFPFVSKYYPELAAHGAYSADEVYTGDDIKDVVEFARVRGVQIVPEIDAPAHAGNGWDWGVKQGLGQLALCVNQQPWTYYCGEPPCGQLNPKNNNTYIILQKLYQELIELTGPTDYFHLGGDEVNLECWAQHFNDTDLRGLWCDFMQKAFKHLKKANNEFPPAMTAVWSSGLTNMPCLSNQLFAVQVWGGSQWQENYQLIDSGYNLIISHVDAWYFDCGFGSWRTTGEAACSPYRSWQNVYRHRPWDTMRLTKDQMKQILGGEACLWTEQVDEMALDSRLWPRASALAERLWTDPENTNDPDTIPRDIFSRMSVFRNRLVHLGLKPEPIFPKYCAQNPDECI
uniref:beta-N-acetylhexosaminidase n=1 Tax=Culicoides sonorensis TaxID=179676 RepID=A0A336MDZ8_CULSO